ncbi:MAG: SMC-Scp complex subunit ScpB [Patescibacteria group bacterium]|jgi:segregation and condensation protein B
MSPDLNQLRRRIESLLFLAGKPLSVNKIAEITQQSVEKVKEVAEALMKEYNDSDRGINIMKTASSYQMATSPDTADIAKEFIKSELTGELTKPALEALTIIAYCGPITKAELEHIRGVNCSLILRNLLIKGLIESNEDRKKMASVYQVTFELLQFLGVRSVEELPDYERLRSHEHITALMEKQMEKQQQSPAPTPEAQTPAE